MFAALARHRLLLIACLLWSVLMVMGVVLTRPVIVPAFATFENVDEKKQAFFEYMRGYADAENQGVLADRSRLKVLRQELQSGSISWFDDYYLARMSALYLPADVEYESVLERLDELLLRVGQVPSSLVLVQAAKESGWGTSRFAREGYNFFGQQCFDPGCGFRPKRRDVGRRHEVARFHNPADSVRAYIHNLNTHARYEKFRAMRNSLRQQQEPLSGITLAAGLLSYSERGQAYVDEVQSMIRSNELE